MRRVIAFASFEGGAELSLAHEPEHGVRAWSVEEVTRRGPGGEALSSLVAWFEHPAEAVACWFRRERALVVMASSRVQQPEQEGARV